MAKQMGRRCDIKATVRRRPHDGKANGEEVKNGGRARVGGREGMRECSR